MKHSVAVFGAGQAGTVEGYQPLFQRLFREVYELESCNLETYFADTQVPHDSDYAYGERIAARVERKHPPSMSHSLGNFTSRLVNTSAPWAVVDEAEHLKQVAVAQSLRIEELERAVSRPRRPRWYAPAATAVCAFAGTLLVGGVVNLPTPARIQGLAVGPDGTLAVQVGFITRTLTSNYFQARVYRNSGASPHVLRRDFSSGDSLVFSRDSRALLQSSPGVVWSLDETDTWIVRLEFSTSGPVAFSADSRRVAYPTYTAALHLTDVEGSSDRVITTTEFGRVTAIGLLGTSPESEQIVVGTEAGRLLLVSSADGAIVEAGQHSPAVRRIRVAPDGARFATVSDSPPGTVKVWEAEQATARELTMLPIEGDTRDVAMNRDGSVAVLLGSGRISLWSHLAGPTGAREWVKQDLFEERRWTDPYFSLSPGETRPVVAGETRVGEVTVITGDGRERLVRVYRATTWWDAIIDDWGVLLAAGLAAVGTAATLWRRRPRVAGAGISAT